MSIRRNSIGRKKYPIWIGAAVLAMALSSPSMAQFNSWGHLEIESYWVSNKSLNSSNVDANYQGVAMRYRFNLGYGDAKTVMAVLGLEANSRAFGETPSDTGTQVIATSGYPTSVGASSSWGFFGSGQPVQGNGGSVSVAGKWAVGGWGSDAIGLQVRHFYLDFTIPNTPLTMQVGAQNIVIGGFLGRFFVNKDIPSVVLNGNFAPHTISAFWWKGVKQNFYMDNDLDYYGLLYRLKQPMFNVEAFFVYGNDRRSVADIWRLTLSSGTSAANTPQNQVTSYPPDPNAPLTVTYNIEEVFIPRPYDQKPWWLGANVPISMGNWKLEPTFIYQGGKYVDSLSSTGSALGLSSSGWSAYLADLTVSYRLGPGLKFLIEGFYATGHDGTKNSLKGDTENQFQAPAPAGFGNENRNVFGNGWSVFYFCNSELSYYAAKQLDISGHAFIRPNVEFNPFPWLNLNFNYLYIVNTANKYVGHIQGIDITGAATGIPPSFNSATSIAGSGPTIGQPNAPNVQAAPGSAGNNGSIDVTKSYIGSEINAIAKIAIYNDLQYAIGFGYFLPGDVYKQPGKTPDNGWSLLTNLRYVF